jgi:hypothetical protein
MEPFQVRFVVMVTEMLPLAVWAVGVVLSVTLTGSE